MATAQTAKGSVDWGAGHQTNAVDLSTIDPGLAVNVAHGGPTGMLAYLAKWEITTLATTKDPVIVNHIKANDSTTNDTASIVVDTVATDLRRETAAATADRDRCLDR